MPNWCATTINISGKKEELQRLYDLIIEWTLKNYMDNGFGNNWLGNILGNSGVDSAEDGDFEYECRGSLTGCDFVGDDLKLYTDTAWVPMLQMWDAICDKYLSVYKILYIADEPGCGVYYTNDPDEVGLWTVDIWSDDDILAKYESMFSVPDDEVVEFLQDVLNNKSNDISYLMRLFHESEIDGVSINQYEYVPISELD